MAKLTSHQWLGVLSFVMIAVFYLMVHIDQKVEARVNTAFDRVIKRMDRMEKKLDNFILNGHKKK